MPQAAVWPLRPTGAPQPQATALAQQPEQRRPIVRLQAPEELIPARPPARLTLPAPEELGVTPARLATDCTRQGLPVDWNVTRDRLHGLGAVGFNLAKLPDGACRVAFVLPTTRPGHMHQIEAEAATEGNAVCRALDLADQWTRQRQ